MPVIAVLGTQWGDEGKGKIIDLLIAEMDIVARFQGGANAGHTVVINGKKFILHLLPSGVLSANKQSVLGNGMVVDLDSFFQEYDQLSVQGVDASNRLFVSNRAHIVFPFHKLLDAHMERCAAGRQIGTTRRGIGPAYAFKMLRKGVRIGDLWLEQARLDKLLRHNLELVNTLFTGLYQADVCDKAVVADYVARNRERIKPFVCDTSAMLMRAIAERKNILVEGAQGSLLDIDHGTYPFVTSSSCTSGGVATGLGIPPQSLDMTIGVIKAYTTRVGEGPFATEASGESGRLLQEKGHEYGATTSRPRRCGWLDLPTLRHTVAINGIQSAVLTKLDVLSGFADIKVCVGYTEESNRRIPTYRTFPGWRQDITGVTAYQDLPAAARSYVAFIEEFLGIPIVIISTGPWRKHAIIRDDFLIDKNKLL